MARLYLTKTLSGFMPSDEPSLEVWRKFKLGDAYRVCAHLLHDIGLAELEAEVSKYCDEHYGVAA